MLTFVLKTQSESLHWDGFSWLLTDGTRGPSATGCCSTDVLTTKDARVDRLVRSLNTLSLGKGAGNLGPPGSQHRQRGGLLPPLAALSFSVAKVRRTLAGAAAAEDQRALLPVSPRVIRGETTAALWARLSTGPIAVRGPRGARAREAVI